MKNFFAICCFCLGLFAVSCNSRPQYAPLEVTDTAWLPATVLVDTILTPVVVGLSVVGDYLAIIYLDQEQNTAHLYSKQGERLVDFCKTGKGPGEMPMIASLYPDRTSNTVWGIDPMMKKLARWSVDSLLSGQKTPLEERPLPQLPMSIDKTASAAQGMLAIGGTGIISPNRPERFFLLDRDGNVMGRYGTYPECEDTIRMKSACMHYSVTLSPDGTRMAHGIYFGAILETFDIRDSIRLRNISYFIEPDFPHDAVGNPTSYDDITLGFGPLCSSDEYIYAAYNGTKDYQKMNNLAVFDWDGRLQKVYRTAFQLIQTAYDPEANAIFALVKDQGEYRLVRFDLPSDE